MALLVNIEGIDGSGKGTQAARLQKRLQSLGRSTQVISFPRYQATQFGRKVADFLNGRFGQLEQVNPFLASMLYAGDRFESRDWLIEAIDIYDVVILDRYIPSNMAHQASKLDGAERTELIAWVEQMEFGIYKLPRPDLCILLDIPPQFAQELIARKAPRDYTEQAADLQEADATHLARTREVYLQLACGNPVWKRVACTTPVSSLPSPACSEQLRSPDDIEAEIWGVVDPWL